MINIIKLNWGLGFNDPSNINTTIKEINSENNIVVIFKLLPEFNSENIKKLSLSSSMSPGLKISFKEVQSWWTNSKKKIM